MTPATLLTDLIARGVEFQAHGDKLQVRRLDQLTPAEVDLLRQYKPTILRLLRSEGREAAALDRWPIVPGTEHWNPYLPAGADGPWGAEFVPSFHVDLRQPSRLRGMHKRIEDQP